MKSRGVSFFVGALASLLRPRRRDVEYSRALVLPRLRVRLARRPAGTEAGEAAASPVVLAEAILAQPSRASAIAAVATV